MCAIECSILIWHFQRFIDIWFYREERGKNKHFDMQSKNVYIAGAAVAALSMVAFALQRKI